MASFDTQQFVKALTSQDGRKAMGATARRLRVPKERGGLGYWPNEITMGKAFVARIAKGDQSCLVISPPQSGKTGVIACIAYLLKAALPSLSSIFLTANDHTDLRSQNLQRLEHVPGLTVLSRSGRRLWDKDKKTPYLVIYDENHFGDGVLHTVHDFLLKFDLKNAPNVIFCGVSATPFSSVGCLDAEVWPDVSELEKAGYNSVATMKRAKRLRESSALFHTEKREPRIELESEVYRHLEKILHKKRVSGYCLVRAKWPEAQLLERHLQKRFAAKVFTKHWNMREKNFSPVEFFRDPPGGVLSVVFVQQKARMGSTIDTKHMHFFYEHFGGSSFADTIVQSLVGRACGFGKLDHRGIVYTKLAVVDAYDAFIRSQGHQETVKRAVGLFVEEGVKLAARASGSEARTAEYAVDMVAEKAFTRGGCREATVVKWYEGEVQRYRHLFKGNPIVRRLSRLSSRTGEAPSMQQLARLEWRPDKQGSSFFCATRPGSGSILIYDDYPSDYRKELASRGIKKTWSGTIVRIFVRTDRRVEALPSAVMATPDSFHFTMRRDEHEGPKRQRHQRQRRR